jgi:hypothetical protein
MESVTLSLINPAALPALRIAATFFLTVNVLAFVYLSQSPPLFRQRPERLRRYSGRTPASCRGNPHPVVFFNHRPPYPAYRALVRVSRERIAIF